MFSRSVFFTVFLLTVISANVVTFILPESYVSTARVHGSGDFTVESEVIRSVAVLKPVADKLNLGVEWGKKYNNGQPVKPDDLIAWLKMRLATSQVRNTSLVEITVSSEDRDEAARLANAIAESYQSQKPAGQVEIVDQAKPAVAPSKPNKPLNIAIGVIAGLVLGAGVGWLVALLKRQSTLVFRE